jgi:putative transposase
MRLAGYDYGSPGAYFVTICAHGRQPLFEERALREIVERAWYGQRQRFPNLALDALVVMPNHIHFIVWLNSVGVPLAGAQDSSSRAGASPAPTLGEVVGSFKSIAATEWLKWLKEHAPQRSGRVWQRNYYERVIRSQDDLARIREYIHLNPLRWRLDCENPQRVPDPAHESEWGWLEGHGGSRRGEACLAPSRAAERPR